MKFLVVDDDPQILDVVTIGLNLQWSDVTVLQAQSGDAALELFAAHQPDVVILDVAMPGRDGYAVLREIRSKSDVPVIMLTARGDDVDQVRGLELGADDYIVKPFSHLVLVARVKAVLRRTEQIPPERATPDFVAGDLRINFGSHKVTLRGETVKLTPVEYRLLYHLVRNAGRLVPHEVLLDRVWGEEYGATKDYLKVFICRLRAKIEPKDGPQLIENERGVGYRFVRPPAARAGASAEQIREAR